MSCLLAPLTRMTRGIPLASTTMWRLEPSLPRSVGFRPVSWPPGAWYLGAIDAGPAPINLVMFTQTHQHGLVQSVPDAAGIPVAQTSPASHATAVAQGLGKVLPWNASVQNNQDAIEGCLIAHAELACATLGGWCEGWNQGQQLSPQFFASGLSCHESTKHKCFVPVSKESGVSSSKWRTVHAYFAIWSEPLEGGGLLEQALKKSGWRGPRETGAQRLKRVLDRGRAEREEYGHGGQQGL